MNQTTEITSADALILSGAGYSIEIAPDAIERKAELLTSAATVTQVTNDEESSLASFHMRKLAGLRIEVEKCRKAVKEPVLAVGKRIDKAAKDFLADLDTQETRLKKMIGDHAAEVARIRAEREAEERKAAEAARLAREEAERAAAAATESRKMSDVIAAKQAERELEAARAARMNAADATHEARPVDNVRFAWDFTVHDIHKLAMGHPELVRIEPRRADIIEAIKAAADEGADMTAGAWAEIGIAPFQKPVVSTR